MKFSIAYKHQFNVYFCLKVNTITWESKEIVEFLGCIVMWIPYKNLT